VLVVYGEDMGMMPGCMLPQVRVIWRQVGMGMFNLVRIVRRPEPGPQNEAEQGHESKYPQCHGNADFATEPA
jgi:hypothetical protein